MKFNGYFYDVRFRWDTLAFKGDDVRINAYWVSSVVTPPVRRPKYTVTKITGSETRVKPGDL